MQYLSTRDKTLRLRAAGAMAIGLSRDGGLFAPEAFPDLGTLDLKVLGAMSYQQREWDCPPMSPGCTPPARHSFR